MSPVFQVKLELVRPGPAHNQLLSPLTDYVALCGAVSPITFNVPVEHRELLRQLSALNRDQDSQRRKAQLDQTAELVERVLGAIDGFKAEMAAAGCQRDDGRLVHLRLVVTPSELALLPFEAANVPQGLPGEKLPLALQGVLPVTITRETRHCTPPPTDWPTREVRVLLAAASPRGLPPVPLRSHLLALRRALTPWVAGDPQPERPARPDSDGPKAPPRFADVVTVLPDASLRSIREACAVSAFTHVHILAHGLAVPGSHDEHFGLALHADSDAGERAVVTGQQLVTALRAQREDGPGHSSPFHVTLASCDSGNVGGVLAPGASIAHDLHTGGIPWVVASQFPLSFAGSAVMAEVLYTRLFRGDDPRRVLHDLRQRLSTECGGTHDWAALVAYAAIDEEFERSWATFRHTQTHRAIDAAFHDLDQVLDAQPDAIAERARPHRERIERYTARFRAAAEESAARDDIAMRSEALGMVASSCKRIAQIEHRLGRTAQAREALEQARAHYLLALRASVRNHWVVGQYLALFLPIEGRVPVDWWYVAHASATMDLEALESTTIAWAHGSLAELYLLALAAPELGAAFPDAAELARAHAADLVARTGRKAFEVTSTRRQFDRYADWWLPAAEETLLASGLEASVAAARIAPLRKTAAALVEVLAGT
ncbi:MAG: CHAT domain-containing protein [Deltaproteobacteria bacterium]|nr:CHAT domain-containing protein [Deltaproteobacteria bacterium]MCB9788890.1 CHAT domain-containing protein [Deltaproteobacteria bacterium]